MTERNDHELLAEFARSESEAAFAELVRRHVSLVYSAALRFTGNPHHAQEITQVVFIILARKANHISRNVILSGWLYQTARLTAANFVKGEVRRQQREQEAYMQSTLTETEAAAWQQLAPWIDEAMGHLGEADRNAVVLRFFENKTAAEVAAALKLTEAAAHKRVYRALEKLRKIFSKRGVTASVMAIAGAISAGSVQAVPAGLAGTISTVVTTKGAAAGGSTLALVKGTLKLMAWTRMKTAVIASAVSLLAGTATVMFASSEATNSLASGKRMMAEHIAEPIDLTPNYTTPASYFDQITQFPAWKTVPRGFHVFNNLPLNIDGMICLWGEGNSTKHNLNFPEQIQDIKVGRKFQTLYVYHGAFFQCPEGTPVCKVVFRYEDNSSVTNALLYGTDILDWVANEQAISPTGTNSLLAWIGGASSPTSKTPMRFCTTAIANSQPDRVVTSIDLYSCKSRATTCILAMTTGQSGLMKNWVTDERAK
jgi:RNA polymerase sigma factor (sigma-70 family)